MILISDINSIKIVFTLYIKEIIFYMEVFIVEIEKLDF